MVPSTWLGTGENWTLMKTIRKLRRRKVLQELRCWSVWCFFVHHRHA
ncbi:unnamed protein product [Arabidopsis thaliana]|uniref:(thale cress) hypothetical protein n=1 Tax=Arabidopsis thaliana TaxID=3702 RepID=A0A7G2F7I3_ARATH|nr:unnamed protein product [Arabidopsis thaliana]